MLEPLPARSKWWAKFRQVKDQLRIEMNSDGSISSLRLKDVLPDMLRSHRQLGMMAPDVGLGTSKAWVVLMFDGFPVDDISIVHYCIFNASLKAEVSTQSESLLRVLAVARISESNAQLHRAADHHHLAEDFNGFARDKRCSLCDPAATAAGTSSEPVQLGLEMFVAADKKGVEVHRGCAPCCPWCTCDETLRLQLPWPLDAPPVLWDASDWKGAGPCPPSKRADLQLDAVCKHPMPSIPIIYELAHKALPGEALPRRCRVCKQAPFATVAERDEAEAQHAAMKNDTSVEGGKKFAAARSKHSSKHFSQYLFEVPPLLVGMDHVVPELLHVGDLNVAKQIYKQGTRRHCNASMLEKLSVFFSGMGVRIRMKPKADGKSAENWFKAAQFNEMLMGSHNFPGGAPAWVPSLVLLLGDMKLEERDKVARHFGASCPAQCIVRARLSDCKAYAVARACAGDISTSALRRQAPAGRTLRQLMDTKYGQSLADTLLNILKGWDKYKVWRRICDEHCEPGPASRDVALRSAIAGTGVCENPRYLNLYVHRLCTPSHAPE